MTSMRELKWITVCLITSVFQRESSHYNLHKVVASVRGEASRNSRRDIVHIIYSRKSCCERITLITRSLSFEGLCVGRKWEFARWTRNENSGFLVEIPSSLRASSSELLSSVMPTRASSVYAKLSRSDRRLDVVELQRRLEFRTNTHRTKSIFC